MVDSIFSVERLVSMELVVRLLESYYEGEDKKLTSEEIKDLDTKYSGGNDLISSSDIIEWFEKHVWIDDFVKKFGPVINANGGYFLNSVDKCHCGKPVYTHSNGFTRGLCRTCDSERCDITTEGMSRPSCYKRG